MPKETVLTGFVFVVVAALLIVMAPGMLSLAFTIIMVAGTVLAFIFGIHRVSRVTQSLVHARRELSRAHEVQSDEMWLVIRQAARLFDYSALDKMFSRYRKDVDAARESGDALLPDVEDYINEETIGLGTWRSVVSQAPGILTGIGILGTFIGLIIGVGGIGFSSVTAAINGVQVLLSGIEVAFYTSIAGLILSILFNLAYRIIWNTMARNLRQFTLDFQSDVIPSTDAQELRASQAYQRRVVELLSRG